MEIGKIIKVDCAVIGDAKKSVDELTSRVQTKKNSLWLKHLNKLKKEYPLKYRKEGRLRAQHIIEVLGEMAGPDAIACTDVGATPNVGSTVSEDIKWTKLAHLRRGRYNGFRTSVCHRCSIFQA